MPYKVELVEKGGTEKKLLGEGVVEWRMEKVEVGARLECREMVRLGMGEIHC